MQDGSTHTKYETDQFKIANKQELDPQNYQFDAFYYKND